MVASRERASYQFDVITRKNHNDFKNQIIMSEMDSIPSSISDFFPKSVLFTDFFVVVVMAATVFIYS